MSAVLSVEVKNKPQLDPTFLPAVLWNRGYQDLVARTPDALPIAVALSRPDGVCFVHRTRILPPTPTSAALNRTYVERLVKLLLWQKGGSRILVGGCPAIADMLRGIYNPEGERKFDVDIVGRRMFLERMTVESCALEEVPAPKEPDVALGRHLEGCRIGFDLGGSDRKCAAVIDGKVVFAEEIPWQPYFQKDPSYHIEGVHDSIRRAAEKLPRVDAIGGSAAGVYVNNEARVASLFRGVAEADFDRQIRGMFATLKARWNNVPFEVANDGEVTALAGSMSMNDNCVLGVSMGTSQAGGYVTPAGHITVWLNELAFVPVDYRPDAPADEWSGDIGCGVQYFSQQAVARLAAAAGFAFPAEMGAADRLVEVQTRMAAGDERARAIYATIGACFGYAIAHYADYYDVRNLLVLGRVTSGEGGDLIIRTAEALLADEFPALAGRLRLRTPSESDKRHGQAIAAASLPALEQRGLQ